MKRFLLPILTVTAISGQTLLEDEKNTIAVYKKASPSVVFIRSKAHVYNYASLNYLDIPNGSGSGFVWDKAGHIVTNYHVIQDADSITVDFDKHTSFTASVVGVDSTKDLAVLKVAAADSLLKPVTLSSYGELFVGRKVMAIGNPFGLDKTLTVGVISALGRQIETTKTRTIRDVIQTDADINPGNSGGPLLDSQGRLAGVNMAIYTTSGSSAGIGFAIPVHTVKHIVPQLIEFGKVKRAGLGITTLPDNHPLAGKIKGAAVLKVPAGSAADKAGLKGLGTDSAGKNVLGDIIQKINGNSVESNDELSFQLEQCRADQQVTITVLRNGAPLAVQVTLQSIQ